VNISSFDMVIIVAYMVGIMLIGILSVRRQTLTGEVYFLAGRSLKWPVIGAALFASNISTIHLVGLAEAGYKQGMVVGNFEWMATFTLILLALVFAPFYFKSRISTLPEFLEKRYGRLARTIMAFMAIAAALLIHIGISLYAGAAVFEEFFGINVYVSIIIISLVTAIYTVVGGLRAVVVTETVQTVILLGGAVLITVIGLSKLPGERDVNSFEDFNMATDVQHSAESLGDTAEMFATADWLTTKPEEVKAARDQIAVIAQQMTDDKKEDAAQALWDAAADYEERRQLGILLGVLRQSDGGKVAEYLETASLLQRARQKNDEPSDVPDDWFKKRIVKAVAIDFDNAVDGLTKLVEGDKAAKSAEETAVALLKERSQATKDMEKLDFVMAVLNDRGEKKFAKFLIAKDKSTFSELQPDVAGAIATLNTARDEVIETNDMNEFLKSDDPVRAPRLSMLRAEGPYLWYAILLGYPILGVWYWCSDQTIVQRVLGAKNQQEAQYGALFAGLLKILPVFFMVLPGAVGYLLFKDQIGSQATKTLPIMMIQLLPAGLLGLMAAALLAALMSTIAAALNSAGTLMAVDIVKHFRPDTTDKQQVFIGRLTAVIVMLLAMVWSTQGGKFGTIFEAINKMPALFLAPPITTVFVWGIFWKRGTKQAAVAILTAGFVIGFLLFLVDFKVFGGVEWISDPDKGLGIPFMMQAVYMFVLWSVVYVAISLATPAPPAEQVENTTWPNPLRVVFHGRLTGIGDPRVLAGVLLVVMVVLYWIFR
jgi:uncharacterized sodium:solute symporter family permease YidK